MTADGQYFYCTGNFNFFLKIYKNNGYGFDLLQTFNLPAKPYFIYNSDNGSYLRVGVDPSLYAYEQLTDGTY